MPKRTRRLLRAIFVAVLVILVAAIAGAWLTLRAGLPVLAGQRVLTGLDGDATVTRDALGVATIRAHEVNDAVACDRFRPRAGTLLRDGPDAPPRPLANLSELFGKVALDADKTHRPFRMRARAAETLASLSDSRPRRCCRRMRKA